MSRKSKKAKTVRKNLLKIEAGMRARNDSLYRMAMGQATLNDLQYWAAMLPSMREANDTMAGGDSSEFLDDLAAALSWYDAIPKEGT